MFTHCNLYNCGSMQCVLFVQPWPCAMSSSVYTFHDYSSIRCLQFEMIATLYVACTLYDNSSTWCSHIDSAWYLHIAWSQLYGMLTYCMVAALWDVHILHGRSSMGCSHIAWSQLYGMFTYCMVAVLWDVYILHGRSSMGCSHIAWSQLYGMFTYCMVAALWDVHILHGRSSMGCSHIVQMQTCLVHNQV